ncbi:C-5 cytosine methyltransferase [Ostreococcus tauri]|uniref:C-5 cytosine methyltransferase n=1 Tax=Ostreococcus tauri TaxID=70448 RepID=A0A090M2J8_OSTTA|nr:C-5 cytosine methyltransferase [Ostreococcus tauri]CEF98470.1 C-5 cytosine methyltransferase [Ostreococcus tauri]|eukprot:XP_003080002.2 C-5 cytosine methyltransferase [Ostreococcus tauri]
MKRTRALMAARDDDTGVVGVAEMYCGIGVMSLAMRWVRRVRARTVVAYDLNPNACDAYARNHGTRPLAKNLAGVSMEALGKIGAEAWLMSPPCQPFTRQGKRLDVEDGRADSFARLVEETTKLSVEKRPRYVFVENVVGFETSKMRELLIEKLREMEFHVQEFILTPTMFGVPYSRPRYFLCARTTHAFRDAVDNIRRAPPPCELSHKRHWIPKYDETMDADVDVAPLSRFLDSENSDIWRENALRQDDIDRAKGCIDIVSSSDTTCNCFTKSYFKYVKGTGSVVANRLVDKSTWDGRTGEGEDDVRLRYFTVDEVMRLHSIPSDFEWPEELSKRQRYTLLGNSMSVACVAPLLEYLFDDDASV